MTFRAFSLIETIVIIAVTAGLSVTLGVLFTYFYRTNAYTLEQTTAVAQARRGVEDAMRYLREASYASDGSYPLESVAASTVTFYANTNADATVEQITYTLSQGTLYRIVGTPTGNPLSYAAMTLATSTIATSVVNSTSTPLFRYFDTTGTELSAPINISKVSSIQTTVVIDVNTSRAPVALTLSAGATLRNLQD